MKAYEFVREAPKDKNSYALVGSGRGDPSGKKGGADSSDHQKLYPPGTWYSKTRKKYNNGSNPGARDGFVG